MYDIFGGINELARDARFGGGNGSFQILHISFPLFRVVEENYVKSFRHNVMFATLIEHRRVSRVEWEENFLIIIFNFPASASQFPYFPSRMLPKKLLTTILLLCATIKEISRRVESWWKFPPLLRRHFSRF